MTQAQSIQRDQQAQADYFPEWCGWLLVGYFLFVVWTLCGKRVR